MLIHTLPYCEDSTRWLIPLLDQRWPIMLDSMGLGRFDIISANPSQTLENGDWQQLQQWHQQRRIAHSAIPFCGGALGFISYDAGFDNKPIQQHIAPQLSLPTMAIGLYDWAIVTDHKKKCVTYYHRLDDKDHWRWLKQQLKNKPDINTFALQQALTPDQDKASYLKAFDAIQRYIHEGDCYQVNLTQRFSADYQGDAFNAYQLLRKHNPAPFAGFMRLDNHDILSCSPERFLQIHNQTVETKPIKGTRPRGSTLSEDQRLANELLNSEKDRAENLMIVDLLRNDLSRSCKPGSVKVPKLFDLESYRAVHHLVSTVTGELSDNANAVDALAQAFPGGSITGAPKIRAMQIIETLEQQRRSVYCGSLLYLSDNGNMDSNIAIRTAVTDNQRLYCWAGGGIVADSKGDDEYQESLDKISTIKHTLESTLNPWHSSPEALTPQPEPRMHGWLQKPHVLSETMRQHCEDLQMRCLRMQFENAADDESEILGHPNKTLVRQIAFFGDDTPWTYARTIIPESTYLAFKDEFDALQHSPIGVTMLYDRDDVSRSNFEYALAPLQAHKLCPFQAQQYAYARRSLFQLGQHPLLITEFFSNAMPTLHSHR